MPFLEICFFGLSIFIFQSDAKYKSISSKFECFHIYFLGVLTTVYVFLKRFVPCEGHFYILYNSTLKPHRPFFCKEGASIGLILLKWGKSKVHQKSLRLMLNDHEYLYTSLKNSFTTEIYNYRKRFPPDEFLLWEKMFII